MKRVVALLLREQRKTDAFAFPENPLSSSRVVDGEILHRTLFPLSLFFCRFFASFSRKESNGNDLSLSPNLRHV